jgi:uncharacterized membrane protein
MDVADPADPADHGPKETVRLEAFSDGVFAIAITLLIIEIHVPEVEGGSRELARALLDLWPSYFAFALSFVTILIMWLNHHAMFLWLRRPDGPVMVGNGVLLLTITALPFSTALLGDYLGHDGQEVAAAVYAAHLVAINLGYTWLWRSMTKRRAMVCPDLDDAEISLTNRYLAFSLVAYLAAFALASWSAAASMALTLMLAAFWTWNAHRRLRVGA